MLISDDTYTRLHTTIARLQREVYALRTFGNNDCTVMADEWLTNPQNKNANYDTPITPEEISHQSHHIPTEVVNILNELLRTRYNGMRVKIFESEVSNPLRRFYDSDEIRARGMLHIEPLYRDSGWSVTYDGGGSLGSPGWYFEARS